MAVKFESDLYAMLWWSWKELCCGGLVKDGHLNLFIRNRSSLLLKGPKMLRGWILFFLAGVGDLFGVS